MYQNTQRFYYNLCANPTTRIGKYPLLFDSSTCKLPTLPPVKQPQPQPKSHTPHQNEVWHRPD